VAVTVAVWLPEIVPLLALKVAVEAPAATVAVAGTLSGAGLLDSATLAPPVGAVWFSVMVQVLAEFCPSMAGLQLSEETCSGATRATLAVMDVALSVAVTVAVWLAPHVPAVAAEVAEVEPAGTVTEAATGSIELLLDRATVVPPLGAAAASETVQVAWAPDARLVGEHSSDDRAGCQFVTVTEPNVDAMVAADPFAKAAPGAQTQMGTVEPLVMGASVTVTVATTPLPIVESVAPIAMHVTEPLTGLQLSVLFAAPRAVPGATTSELTLLAAKSNLHCKPAGAPPVPFKVRLSTTEPPPTAAPDERLTEDAAGAEAVKAMLAVEVLL